MSTVTLPRSGVPLTSIGHAVSNEYYRWMHDITERVGGVTGPGTNDLAAAQFEDAGIEEMRSELFRMSDEARQAQSLAYELAERLSASERQIAASQQWAQSMVSELAERLLASERQIAAIQQGTAI